ncbi:MAG: hypothetical protein ACR2PD_00935, partial [Luminiphilus sp.]
MILHMKGLLRNTIALLTASALLVACSDSARDLPVPDSTVLDPVSDSSGQQSGTGDSVPAEQRLLLAVAEEILLPNYQSLKDAADSFVASDGALNRYCALGPEALIDDSEFRESFHDLLRAVQLTEMHALGPAMV